jgi:hypothetical protein
MRKLISTMIMGAVVAGLGIGLPGCSEESKTESQTTTSTPGGKRVESETKSVKESGQNPPPAPPKTP